MKPETVYNMITQMFSEDGYQMGNIYIKCESETKITIEQISDQVMISFSGNKPVAIIKKFIKLSRSVSGLHLGSTGGTLVLDAFPDIPFEYDEDE